MISDYRRGLAWKAGHKAARAGNTATANNRQRGTIYYDDWADGWREGDLAAPPIGDVVTEEGVK